MRHAPHSREDMKAFTGLIMIMGLAACTGTPQKRANNAWPLDPQERSAAQRVVAQMEGEVHLAMPPGMEFIFRRISKNRIQDNYDYHLEELRPIEQQRALRQKTADNYVREQGYRACGDHDMRYLLDKGYVYEFYVKVFVAEKAGIAKDNFAKGFCVANEVPLVDQKAIDARYSKLRYWPNGDRIDPRLIEQIMGAFQVAAAKYQPPELDKLAIKTVSTEADGLMITLNVETEQKNSIKMGKYWAHYIKGKAMEKSCTNKASLTSLMVGAVYRFQVDVKAMQDIVGDGIFTISYPDCLLYNKKP